MKRLAILLLPLLGACAPFHPALQQPPVVSNEGPVLLRNEEATDKTTTWQTHVLRFKGELRNGRFDGPGQCSERRHGRWQPPGPCEFANGQRIDPDWVRRVEAQRAWAAEANATVLRREAPPASP